MTRTAARPLEDDRHDLNRAHWAIGPDGFAIRDTMPPGRPALDALVPSRRILSLVRPSS